MTERASVVTLNSKLFAEMIERLGLNRPLRILDFGPASSQTLEFFSGSPCKLFFADLYSEPLVLQQQRPDPENPPSEAALVQAFGEFLHFPHGTRFDLILFWDVLNFIDAPSVRALGMTLVPFLHRATLGHGFGVLNSKTRLTPMRYSIAEADTLSCRPREDQLQALYPHPQAELERTLVCLEVSRRVLLGDGRLEVLLQPRG